VIQEAKESEKEMEKKLEGAMEQLKVLNLDFGRECLDRKTLVRTAISKIKEKVSDTDRPEVERIMRGARVDILGKCTSPRETDKGRIHTVPVLITCGCRSMKGRVFGKESWFENVISMAEGKHGVKTAGQLWA
jgi:hypothetical protein